MGSKLNASGFFTKILLDSKLFFDVEAILVGLALFLFHNLVGGSGRKKGHLDLIHSKFHQRLHLNSACCGESCSKKC